MKPLFQEALEQIDATRVQRTTASHAAAISALDSHTNQQILDAAKAHYAAMSDIVDTNTTNGVTYAQSADGAPQVRTLNAYDWKSQQAGPITPTVMEVSAAPTMSPGLQSALASSNVLAVNLGISESAQFIIGEEGGVGIAFDTEGNVGGTAYLAGKLGLDIDIAINLQVGIWASDVAGLAGTFVGVEVNLDLDVGVSLGIFLHPDDLSFYGFAIGIGVGEGGGATIVGGYTVVF